MFALIILVLFLVTFLGAFVAGKVFWYEMSVARMAASAACFTFLLLIPFPIPYVSLVLAAIGLFICLNDRSYETARLFKVFGLTIAFPITAYVGMIFYSG